MTVGLPPSITENAAVRGAKVNADNFAHRCPSLKSVLNGDILIRDTP